MLEPCLLQNICVYTYIYMYMHIYIYTYMYIYREREQFTLFGVIPTMFTRYFSIARASARRGSACSKPLARLYRMIY